MNKKLQHLEDTIQAEREKHRHDLQECERKVRL